MGKLLAATALGGLLIASVQQPCERLSAALAKSHRRGHFQRAATTTCVGNFVVSDEGRDRVDSNRDVKDRVQW